jgi:predicted MPP superfamily phosphohydrolase
MILFLLTFLFLYGSLHFYIFSKISGALAVGTVMTSVVILFMAIMVSAPVLVHIAEKRDFELSARLISHIGYTWMGFAFLFFAFSLAVDLYRFSLYVGGLLLRANLSHLAPSTRLAFAIPVVAAACVASYGYFEALHIQNDTLIIKSSKIREEVGPLTIAMISDVHLGLIVREERLRRILREVEKAEPDILVSAGDLVDGQIDNLTRLAELLQAFRPRYGKYAVTGNHEFYAGLDQTLRFTEMPGFTVLRGEAQTVAGAITIAGVDDPTAGYFGASRGISEGELLAGLDRDKFTILLKHQPRVTKQSLGLFDLQLSGHTHNGQIFPFTLLSRLFFPIKPGLIHLSPNSSMYVSRGSGTWGPPIRFLSPPEITVIKLVHGE